MDEPRQTPPPADPTPIARGRWFQLAAVGLTLVSALAGTGLARWLRQPLSDTNPNKVATAGKFPNRLFEGWKNPDLILVVSAQQLGYLLPCGCSRPQYGGLERRYNLLQLFKDAGWPYAAVDLGDMAQKHGITHLPNQQAKIKWMYSMKALKEMDYTAVGFGLSEVQVGLPNLLDEYCLNDQKPRLVVGNLIDAEKHFPTMTAPWETVRPVKTNITVGVTSVIGPNVAARIKELSRNDPRLRFERTPDAIDRALKEMRERMVSLPVLLFQGPVTRVPGKKPYTEAAACAEAYPQFPLLVALSDEDEASLRPVEVTTKTGSKSHIITLGKKGRFVGVFGVWRTNNSAKPFEFKYERVELGEEFMTPEGKEKGHPVVELIEKYTQELKDANYLEKYGQVRHALQVMPKVPGIGRDVEVRYAGSDVCKRCHEHAYEVWKKTPHSHAYKTLVDAKKPGNRQFDPECIVCHTVGYGYHTGYVSETKTPAVKGMPNLKDVGCESCHGPAYVHVQNPNDQEWHKRINPWKYLPANKREAAIDDMCQKCHDIDNDVTWVGGGFKRKWPKVEHATPPGEKPTD